MKFAMRPSFRKEAASNAAPTIRVNVAVAAIICSGALSCPTSASAAPVSIPIVAVVLMLRRPDEPNIA